MRAALTPLLFGVGAFGLSAAMVVAFLGADLRYVGFEEPLWFAAVALPLVALLARTLIAKRPATLLFSRTQTLRRIGTGALAPPVARASAPVVAWCFMFLCRCEMQS